MKIQPKTRVVLLLVVVTLALYARSANLPFCEIDDRDYVSDNAQVAAGLTLDSIKWAFTTFHAANWHPLTWLSLMADSQFFGTLPAGYHIVNVVMHAANAALLFILLNSLTGALWRSAFVAACFAVHPLHVESVAWISERKDVLSTIFWMLTLICYGEYVKNSRRGMYLLSLGLFALGLMAKPMLVTIPVILLVLDFWPLRRLKLPFVSRDGGTAGGVEMKPLKFLLLEKAPYLLLASTSAVVTVYAQSHGGAVATLRGVSVALRVENALWSLLVYIGKMFLPLDLGIYYPLLPVPVWKAACGLVAVLVITFFSIRKIREFPWLASGWFWYLVTLLPVIGLVQVGSQAMADRYTYVPYIGLFWIAAWGGVEIASRLRVSCRQLGLAAGVIVLLLSSTTLHQLSYWQDNLELLSHTVDITEDNYVVSYALALAYEREGQTTLAIEQYRKAIKGYPDNPDREKLHLHLGDMLNAQGESREALQQYDEALRLKPDFWQAYYNKGLALEKLGDADQALQSYFEVLRIKPDEPGTHNNIGRMYAQRGNVDAAIQHFTLAVQANPALDTARNNLQRALQQKGQGR